MKPKKKSKPKFSTDDLAMSIHTALRKACFGRDASLMWNAISKADSEDWGTAVRVGCEWVGLERHFILTDGNGKTHEPRPDAEQTTLLARLEASEEENRRLRTLVEGIRKELATLDRAP